MPARRHRCGIDVVGGEVRARAYAKYGRYIQTLEVKLLPGREIAKVGFTLSRQYSSLA
jgi:hypothetical protein